MTESTFDQPAPAMAAAQRQNMIARRVRTVTKLLIHLLLIVGGFAVLIPFFWMVSSSLKPDWEIFQIPPAWIPEDPLWQNYAIVLTGHRPDAEGSGAGQGWSFLGFVWNTGVVSGIKG